MDKINLQAGKIIYNEFHIDFKKPFSEQLDALMEDLVQIDYEDGYLIDLGWHPEYNPQGNFFVQVIKDYNWEKPIYKQQSSDGKQLKELLLKAIDIIKNNLWFERKIDFDTGFLRTERRIFIIN